MNPDPLDADEQALPLVEEKTQPVMGCPVHMINWGVRPPKPVQSSLPLELGIPSKDISNGGSARTYSGAVMEIVLKGLLSLDDGPVNGTAAVCPDAYTHKGRPCEMKSLRKGRKLVVYDWRLKKDLLGTIYIVGVHNRDKCENLSDIWTKLSKQMHCVMMLGDWEVRQLAYRQPLQKIKSNKTASGERNGYQRKGYSNGYYNIPNGELVKRCCVELPFPVSFSIHGLNFKCPVFVSKFILHGEPRKYTNDQPPS